LPTIKNLKKTVGKKIKARDALDSPVEEGSIILPPSVADKHGLNKAH
jgi:hypothetical protein